MRKITDHIVEGDSANHQLTITVRDEPGSGGANHMYGIEWTPKDDDTCRDQLLVLFQNGPIKEFGVNGVTHEALLSIVIDRLRSFQAGPFKCVENEIALRKIEDALWQLHWRTSSRIARGVEGTHQK